MGMGNNFAHGNGGIPLGLIDVDRFVDKKEVVILAEKLNAVNDYLDRMRAIARDHPVLRIFDYSSHVER